MKGTEITVDVASLNSLVNNLNSRLANVRNVSGQGVSKAGDVAFARSQERVPVMTGALKDSGKVTSQNALDEFKTIISYGDSAIGHSGRPTSDYAVERHEIFNPNKPEAYKYLERALRESDTLFLEELVRLLGNALR